jgi:hypothetical protein
VVEHLSSFLKEKEQAAQLQRLKEELRALIITQHIDDIAQLLSEVLNKIGLRLSDEHKRIIEEALEREIHNTATVSTSSTGPRTIQTQSHSTAPSSVEPPAPSVEEPTVPSLSSTVSEMKKDAKPERAKPKLSVPPMVHCTFCAFM